MEAFKVCHRPEEESETVEKVEVTKEDEALIALHRNLKVGRPSALGWQSLIFSYRFTKINLLSGVSKTIVSDAPSPGALSSYASSFDSGGPCSSSSFPSRDYSSGSLSSSRPSTPCAISKSRDRSGIPGMKLRSISSFMGLYRVCASGLGLCC